MISWLLTRFFQLAGHRTLLIRGTAFTHDALVAAVALTLGLGLRVGFGAVLTDTATYLTNIFIFAMIASVVGFATGLNSGIWRYASLTDLKAIFITSVVTLVLFAIVSFMFNRLDGFPRSTLMITWAMHVLLLAAACHALRARPFADAVGAVAIETARDPAIGRATRGDTAIRSRMTLHRG